MEVALRFKLLTQLTQLTLLTQWHIWHIAIWLKGSENTAHNRLWELYSETWIGWDGSSYPLGRNPPKNSYCRPKNTYSSPFLLLSAK